MLQSGLKLFSEGAVYVLLLFPLYKKKEGWYVMMDTVSFVCSDLFLFFVLGGLCLDMKNSFSVFLPVLWGIEVWKLHFPESLIEVSCRICQGNCVL